MKIRHKITLWITGAGLLAGILFSVIISWELIEQPYELLDSELDSQAHSLLAGFIAQNNTFPEKTDSPLFQALGRWYWLKIFTTEQKLIYTSAMAGLTDIPLKILDSGYNIQTTIPRKTADLEQGDRDEVTFRVRTFSLPLQGEQYLVQIARPMEKLQEEIGDLIFSIAAGLVCFTLSLILFGYFAAGRILQPIAEINTLAREISEKTLDKRIPLPPNRDELYALSSSLNQMFDRLQFSFQQQKEFLANAAHELKTPLAMQRLFFDEALQRTDLPLDMTTRMDRQAVILFRMNRLIKNLLDLSALECGDIALASEQVDLTRLLSSVVNEFREIIQAAGIILRLDCQDAVLLVGDREKLRQMLINLLDNAIKYNRPENGRMDLALKADNGNIQFSLYNTGEGIPADELDRVFVQFYRLEKSRSSMLGGSGLGLAIVRRIVELHRGKIEINSEVGQWVRVTLLLPATSEG